MSLVRTDLAMPGSSARCSNPARHVPRPRLIVWHHAVPESWGGATDPTNLVAVCPTCHMNAHVLIDQYVRAKDVPFPSVLGAFDAFTKALAARAWTSRPAVPTYTL